LIQKGETQPGFRINAQAMDWWEKNGLSASAITQLAASSGLVFCTADAWNQHLDTLGVTNAKARTLATEGALWGEICEQELLKDKIIVSDGSNRGKTPGIPSLPIIFIAFVSVLWCR
jgi:hypothetical protein